MPPFQTDDSLTDTVADILTWLIQNLPLILAAIAACWRVLRPPSGSAEVLVNKEIQRRDPAAVQTNGNGAAALALATLGQAHQNELARLSRAFEDFVDENRRWREAFKADQDAKIQRLFETTNRHEMNLYEYSKRLRALEPPEQAP